MNRVLVRFTAIFIGVVAVLPVRAAYEAGLKRLWDRHMAEASDHAAVVEACREFVKTNPADPLVPVARGIEAWRIFQLGKPEEAAAVLKPYLAPGAGTVNAGAAMVARGWFTRLDREKVAEWLQAYYRQEVRYPGSLTEIPAHPRVPKSKHAPLADRFGKPWRYASTGFKGLKGFEGQRYELTSAVLGDASELAGSLKRPYGSGFDAVPGRVFDRQPPLVVIKRKGAASAVPVGKMAGDVYLAFLGEKIVVLCNHSYWKVSARP